MLCVCVCVCVCVGGWGGGCLRACLREGWCAEPRALRELSWFSGLLGFCVLLSESRWSCCSVACWDLPYGISLACRLVRRGLWWWFSPCVLCDLCMCAGLQDRVGSEIQVCTIDLVCFVVYVVFGCITHTQTHTRTRTHTHTHTHTRTSVPFVCLACMHTYQPCCKPPFCHSRP